MKRERGILIFILGILFLFILGYFLFQESFSGQVVFGSEGNQEFELGNLSYKLIQTSYGPGESIRGWINISFENVFLNSVFSDNLGNSISITNLLNKSSNSNYVYTCSPSNCISDYSANNGELTKILNLNSGDKKILGFKFTGDLYQINSINFKIESDAISSCSNQLEIDFFDDETYLIKNNKTSSFGSCVNRKSYGCFDDTKETTLGEVRETPYCQKVIFSESPGFLLGAWVQRVSGLKNITMSLYNLDGEEIEDVSCQLPSIEIGQEEEIFCEVDYLVSKAQEYYVCLSSNTGEGVYKIRGNSIPENICGFYGYPLRSETAAYQIFAEGKKFASFGEFNVVNSISSGEDLNELTESYISRKYGNLDCSSGCIVPLKITSYQNQQVILSNLKIEYDKTSFPGSEENNFYELEETPPKISSKFQKLNLEEGNFSTPNTIGNSSFQLFLESKMLFAKQIFIEDVPLVQSLIPTTTASTFPTTFKVDTGTSSVNYSYKWNFGDNNSEKTSQTNQITYTYDSIGEYTLTITLTDSFQRSSSKSFKIIVESPKKILNSSLKEMQNNLKRIELQLENFSSFSQNSLRSFLNLNSINNQLVELQKKYIQANSETEYQSLIQKLLNLKIPKSIIKSESAQKVPFFQEKNNLNLNFLQEIGGGEYDSSKEEEYLDAAINWYQNNIETKINFEKFKINYENDLEENLNVFDIQIKIKNSLEEDPYFILSKLTNLNFKQDYSQIERGNYLYFELSQTDNKIGFSTTEQVDFINIPLVVVPKIKELPIIIPEEPIEPKWLILGLILLFVLVGGFVTYIVLQVWYKKKYENHLFKNRNHLYNLITYIENSKKKGLEEEEISKRLKKAGWNSEQIRYVTRKYIGKTTGMFEIPFQKAFRIFKKKREEKMQRRDLDSGSRLNSRRF